MPFYRVTLAENTRCCHKHDPIEAATPEAAADMARELGAWTQTEFGDTADAEEPTFFVDECDEDGGRHRRTRLSSTTDLQSPSGGGSEMQPSAAAPSRNRTNALRVPWFQADPLRPFHGLFF